MMAQLMVSAAATVALIADSVYPRVFKLLKPKTYIMYQQV